MATIKPFSGLRYNPLKITDLSAVVTQPYDRIHPAEQKAYYARHPYNIVRIIQGEREPDTPADNVYTRARAYAEQWQKEGVLIREPQTVLYVTQQTFTTPAGQTFTRTGFTAALKLTALNEGTILPHERTLSGPKADRLNLFRATETGWSSVFILYPDAENKINALLQPYLTAHPPVGFREPVIEPDVEQRFWVVDDSALCAQIVAEMAPKRNLIIADGHHRYETALNYREERRRQDPLACNNAPFNFVMATFVSMADPGLVILPTHRLIHAYTRLDAPALLNALEPYFHVEAVADLPALQNGLAQADPRRPRFGFYNGAYTLLTLRPAEELPAAIARQDLDVAILHDLILEQVMGLSKESVAAEENIRYLRLLEPGLNAVDKAEANFLFILNPTRIEQVQSRSEAGQKMPQKSTDFYPKIITGLSALPLTD